MTKKQVQAAWAVLGVVGVGAVALLVFALSLNAKQPAGPAEDAPAGGVAVVTTTSAGSTTTAVVAEAPAEATQSQGDGGQAPATAAQQVGKDQPVQQTNEPDPTTTTTAPGQPGNTLTTTPPRTTSRVPDVPWCYRVCTYTQAVDLVRRHTPYMTQQDRDAVLGGNMAALLGLARA